MANVNEVILPYIAYLVAGTISGMITKLKDMVPDPPRLIRQHSLNEFEGCQANQFLEMHEKQSCLP